jgi:hypothetical protein
VFKFINGGDKLFMEALVNIRPVSVYLDLEFGFQFYNSGVLDYDFCSSKYNDSNHAVALVGYDTELDYFENNIDYYILRNSWGTQWGLFKFNRTDLSIKIIKDFKIYYR